MRFICVILASKLDTNQTGFRRSAVVIVAEAHFGLTLSSFAELHSPQADFRRLTLLSLELHPNVSVCVRVIITKPMYFTFKHKPAGYIEQL